MSKFKKSHALEQRKIEANRIKLKYPDRIPAIVELAEKADLPALDRNKFLVPSDITVAQFIFIIRKRIKLTAEKAIFVFVNNTLPPTSETIGSLYEKNKDEDQFLYCTISSESTFGTDFFRENF